MIKCCNCHMHMHMHEKSFVPLYFVFERSLDKVSEVPYIQYLQGKQTARNANTPSLPPLLSPWLICFNTDRGLIRESEYGIRNVSYSYLTLFERSLYFTLLYFTTHGSRVNITWRSSAIDICFSPTSLQASNYVGSISSPHRFFRAKHAV